MRYREATKSFRAHLVRSAVSLPAGCLVSIGAFITMATDFVTLEAQHFDFALIQMLFD